MADAADSHRRETSVGRQCADEVPERAVTIFAAVQQHDTAGAAHLSESRQDLEGCRERVLLGMRQEHCGARHSLQRGEGHVLCAARDHEQNGWGARVRINDAVGTPLVWSRREISVIANRTRSMGLIAEARGRISIGTLGYRGPADDAAAT